MSKQRPCVYWDVEGSMFLWFFYVFFIDYYLKYFAWLEKKSYLNKHIKIFYRT